MELCDKKHFAGYLKHTLGYLPDADEMRSLYNKFCNMWPDKQERVINITYMALFNIKPFHSCNSDQT